ncbi:polysaccharide biosynthesis/export family protein [Sphingomonas sp.]|uniref:polysaccharide biosynthesis/export family protein n=1 Tax=Sphingomonas sp. TaxID=28214 RepID=UPI003B3AB121
MDIAYRIDTFTIGQAVIGYWRRRTAKEKAFWHGSVRAYERRGKIVQKWDQLIMGIKAVLGLLALLSGTMSPALAQNAAPSAEKAAVATAATDLATAGDSAAYRLGSGDKVRITVFNEETLSGEYEVDGSGTLALQLIGSIKVQGKTIPEVTAIIVSKLKEGYLQNPSVAIEVLNYRPFYVLGEVKEPGKYPYVSGMTVLNAIALAGGYTYRGKKDRAMVIRSSDPEKKEQRVAPNDIIMPGDIIRVPERVF